MPDIQWDHEASLMRVTAFDTADTAEELVARGTVYELVGMALELPAETQDGLLLRVADADDVTEYDGDEIRELAGHPDYTSAYGDDDTAERADDGDNDELEDELPVIDGGVSAPAPTDSSGQDGQK